MPLKIEVLGSNCGKCNTLYSRLNKIVANYSLEAEVTKNTNLDDIMSFGINYLPALVLNGKLISQGVVLSEIEIIKHLNQFLVDDKKISLPKKNKICMPIFMIILLGLGIGLTFFILRNRNVLEPIQKSADSISITSKPISIKEKVNQQYNYTKQSTSFKITFLEFGSVNCSECKKMKKVMEKVEANFPDRVQVVFYDVRKKENKPMMELFKIDLIPAQVLLDSAGIEYFRHEGYIDYQEIIKKFNL